VQQQEVFDGEDGGKVMRELNYTKLGMSIRQIRKAKGW